MGLRRFVLVLDAMGAAALITALPADAKEDVQATLTMPVPLDAGPGTELTVAWKLFSVDDQGRRQPFGANGVFVRLLSGSGAAATEGVAPAGGHPTGEYEATVVVPDGGIRDVEIGLAGWVSDTEGTRRSDVIFPITNDPIPTAAPVTSPASGGSTATSTWVVIGVASLLCLLGALTGALALRKRRGRDATARGRVAGARRSQV
jgi:hypothetical protein